MERQEIINTLFENMSAMKRGMSAYLHPSAGEMTISHAQLELLFAIKHTQPISAKQLAGQLYLTPGAISQSVDGLTRNGYCVSTVDPTDRRKQFLKLTKKGDKLVSSIEKRRKGAMEQLMQSLTSDELTMWLTIQQKMIAQFQTDAKAKHKETV